MFCFLLYSDIQSVIVKYINNIEDLLSWKNTCKDTYYINHVANFVTTSFYEGIIVKYICLNSYITYPKISQILDKNGHYIEQIHLSPCITNNHIKYMYNLKYLNCSDNFIITENILKYLPNLTYLVCGSLDINNEESFKKISDNLIYLDCTNTSNVNNCGIRMLKNLRYLKCGSVLINDSVLYSLPNLLELSTGEYSYFYDDSIKTLTNLITLECGNSTYITDKSLVHLHNLRKLYCSNAINIKLHFYTTNLTELHCGNCNLIDNKSLMNIPNLERLYCDNNINITSAGILQLKKIIYLDTGYNNNINKFPNSLKYLCSKKSTNSIYNESFGLYSNIEVIYANIHNFLLTYTSVKRLRKIKYVNIINTYGTDIYEIGDTIKHTYEKNNDKIYTSTPCLLSFL